MIAPRRKVITGPATVIAPGQPYAIDTGTTIAPGGFLAADRFCASQGLTITDDASPGARRHATTCHPEVPRGMSQSPGVRDPSPGTARDDVAC
jgi:hypothetical protein